jgi:hypothetical protein
VTDEVVAKQDSKERVALELMYYIANQEAVYPKGQEARPYYLELYQQCWRVASGRSVK